MEHHLWLIRHCHLPNDDSNHAVLIYVPIDQIVYIVMIFHDDMIWLYVHYHYNRNMSHS